MKKKIAILTLPLNHNYGGILQAYALRQVLLTMGHKVFHIEEKRNESVVHWSSSRFYFWWYTRRLFRQILTLNLNKRRNKQNRMGYDLRQRTSLIRSFVKNNIPRMIVDKFDELKKENFDCVVVGSDQIWRPIYYRQIADAYLKFTEGWDVKRMAYAPSFGTDDWEYSEEQMRVCAKLLKQFDAVSLRERQGVEFCKTKFDVIGICVLDPTMLLTHQDYKKLVGKQVGIQKRQLTTYILDMNEIKNTAITRVQEERGLNIIELGNAVDNTRKNKNIIYWLQQLMQAEYIITDSFHGCVFAILFQRPFLVFGNHERGLSRFTTLLARFGLEDRMVHMPEDVQTKFDTPIDWYAVNKTLDEERRKSKIFLEEHLQTT